MPARWQVATAASISGRGGSSMATRPSSDEPLLGLLAGRRPAAVDRAGAWPRPAPGAHRATSRRSRPPCGRGRLVERDHAPRPAGRGCSGRGAVAGRPSRPGRVVASPVQRAHALADRSRRPTRRAVGSGSAAVQVEAGLRRGHQQRPLRGVPQHVPAVAARATGGAAGRRWPAPRRAAARRGRRAAPRPRGAVAAGRRRSVVAGAGQLVGGSTAAGRPSAPSSGSWSASRSCRCR